MCIRDSGYTVVPKQLVREGQSLNAMWNRRQTTKFNGASYIIQKGAAAIYTEQGKKEIEANIAYYQANAKLIKESLSKCGLEVYGAVNSPYAVSYTHLACALETRMREKFPVQTLIGRRDRVDYIQIYRTEQGEEIRLQVTKAVYRSIPKQVKGTLVHRGHRLISFTFDSCRITPASAEQLQAGR